MKLYLIGAALLLTACSSAPREADAPTPPPPPADSCGASGLQGLVGRLKSDIPADLDQSRLRVTCTTCPVTRDYRPDRLNIFFEEATGVVRQVNCG